MRGRIILVYLKIGYASQTKHCYFLGVDYTILGNYRILKQQQ